MLLVGRNKYEQVNILTSDGIRHWHRVQTKPTPRHYHYYRPHYVQADPIDIEMTSYALLTYAAENDFAGGIPVMKWIMNQRNSWGGFGSTQVNNILYFVCCKVY